LASERKITFGIILWCILDYFLLLNVVTFSNFGQKFLTAARFSNLGETSQLRLVLSNFSEAFQLQTFQLKLFQRLVLSNCPYQLQASLKIIYFSKLPVLIKIENNRSWLSWCVQGIN